MKIPSFDFLALYYISNLVGGLVAFFFIALLTRDTECSDPEIS